MGEADIKGKVAISCSTAGELQELQKLLDIDQLVAERSQQNLQSATS
jgi:hypothetical protein